MSGMKCPNCGGVEFGDYDIGHSHCVEGQFISSVNAYVCLNGGRVELYAKQEILDQRMAKLKKEQEAAAEATRINQQIEAKKQELEELRAIIDDENQTVKAVKEAQEKVNQVENEIRSLENQRVNANCARSRFGIW